MPAAAWPQSAPAYALAETAKPKPSLNFWDPVRGILIAHDQPGNDAMVLRFDIDAQAPDAGNAAHAAGNRFSLSALRRTWVIDLQPSDPQPSDPQQSPARNASPILIDGKGQGPSPIGGHVEEMADDPGLTVVAGENAQSFDWESTAQKAAHAASPRGFQWNPVQMAFRTVALRRGPVHSYALVFDDIRKDADPHSYDWRMPVPGDLVVLATRPQSVILGNPDPGDRRRLLVQMLSVEGSGNWTLEPSNAHRTPGSGRSSNSSNGKQLRFTTRSVEPRFRVLLYPYMEGAPLPAVLSAETLAIDWQDQHDTFSLTRLASGRTAIGLAPPH